jgi:hypothetical protein
VALAGFGPGGRWGRAGRYLGFAAAAAVVGLNVEPGIRFGGDRRSAFRELEGDVRDGMPPRFVAGKYPGRLWTDRGTGVAIDRLRRHRVSFFRYAAADPDVEIVPAPLPEPRPAIECLSNDPFRPGGPKPPRTPIPPPPRGRRVEGASVVLSVPETVPWLSTRLCWRTADGGEGSAEAHPLRWPGLSRVEFWTGGQVVTEAWLEAGCPTRAIPVESVDWLLLREAD